MVTADFYGTSQYVTLELTQQGDALTGRFAGDKLVGTVHGDTLQFLATGGDGGTEEARATLAGGAMSGTIVFAKATNPGHPATHAFTALRSPPRPTRSPQRHVFTPTAFPRQFSALIAPVLHVAPGDTIATTTIDAGGTDAKGIERSLGGNPETGPFFVDGAQPGDTLVIHLVRVRLDRDWAFSNDGIVARGLDRELAVRMHDAGQRLRWHLDLPRSIATSEKPGSHLARYQVPLHPMLGCIGVAPPPAVAGPTTGDSGVWGGNMDFNEVVEGATIYLPVGVPGALLYIGDGHAAQGDGELTGTALETSLAVEFSVDLVRGKVAPGPRVESPTHVAAMGLAGSLDDAFRAATANMAAWLGDDYELTPSEIAQVLGTAAEYRVTEVADRNAGIVLKIARDRLRALAPAAK